MTDPAPSLAAPRRLPAFAAYGSSLLLVAVATLAAVVMSSLVAAPDLSLIFVLPVVIAAVSFGWGPALAAAVGGMLADNYFLIAPRYSLRVADPDNVWALALLLAVAAIVSVVAAQARRRALEAGEAADRALALQALARTLLAASGPRPIAEAVAQALSRLFQAPAVVLLNGVDGLEPAAQAGGADLAPEDLEAARWAVAAGLPTRGGVYPAGESRFDFWPLITPQRQQAAIGVTISGRETGRPADPERLVDVVAAYLSVTLDREYFARQALDNQVAAAREQLKSDLLAAVSHDLKTPLSTLLVTLQSLQRFGDAHDPATRAQLLALAEAEATRLSGFVSNLLDMSRLDAAAVPVHAASAQPRVLADEAIARATAALAGHPVINTVMSEAPALRVDAQLFESALANVLENAAKYSSPGSPIELRAGSGDGEGWIEVLDEGQGFPEPAEPMFAKFARGVTGDGRPPGTGLGLSIARGFLEAQGGRIEAQNRHDRPGAVVRLWAPLSA